VRCWPCGTRWRTTSPSPSPSGCTGNWSSTGGCCPGRWPAILNTPAVRGLRELVDASPADFFGSAATGVDDLLRHRTVAANLHRALTAETDPHRRELLRGHLDRAKANITRTDPFVRWLLAMAHVWRIRTTFHEARRWCLLAVALVATGAVAFLTATGG